MSKFEMINNFYHTIKADGTRLWSEKQVENAVKKGWITAKEFEIIVKEISNDRFN